MPGAWLPGAWLPGAWLPGAWLPGAWLPGAWPRARHRHSKMPRLVLHYSPAACWFAAHAALEHSGLPSEPVAHHITRGEHLFAE